MNFEVVPGHEALVIRLDGDLIEGGFIEEIIEVVDAHIINGSKAGIINIEKVDYLNSSGIGMLITVLTKFRNKGGDVALVNPSEHVKKLLIITKLQNIFNIAGSEAEALQIFRKIDYGKS